MVTVRVSCEKKLLVLTGIEVLGSNENVTMQREFNSHGQRQCISGDCCITTIERENYCSPLLYNAYVLAVSRESGKMDSVDNR